MSMTYAPRLLQQRSSVHQSTPYAGFVSALLAGGIAIPIVLLSEPCQHWFVIPVFFCGAIIGVDALDWLTGRRDIFDPIAITGIYGFHFFFLCPLLHVYWDSWPPYLAPPQDWTSWLGYMASFNAIGLLIYRYYVKVFSKATQNSSRPVWRLNQTRFCLLSGLTMLVSLALQTWVLARFGGISGYIAAFSSYEAFENMGIVFALSESFPIVSFVFYIARRENANKRM
ncbi:MAG TPA: hypothetical protein VGM98_15790, partial [Schlesneria sp.]